MANNIKGITIQIDADGTPLERAINDINKESQALSSELRTINNQLKFDPQNTVVLQQKFDVLGEQIQKTKTKLETLENAQAKVKDAYDNGEIDDGQYRAFQREVEKAKNYLENLEEQQGEVETALTRANLSSKYEELQGQISDTQSHLEDLQAQQEALGDVDINSDAYTELASEIADVTAELEGLQAEASGVQSELDELEGSTSRTTGEVNSLNDGLSSSRTSSSETSSLIQQLSGAMSSASSQAGALGGAIGGLISGGFEGLIGLAGQVIEEVVKMAQAFDEANSVIVEKTGASGEALEEFKRIASETAVVVDGLDVSGTAGVVGELATRLDLTGEELERATILIGKFADATGTDAEGAVVRISKVMKTWGVETQDMESLLDKFTVASQKSGISVDSLAQDLDTYKFQLQEAGFTLDEAIAMLSQFEKGGITTSKVLRGFTTATTKWAKEGKTASEGYQDLIRSMSMASSSQEAFSIAVEYFGKNPAQELTFALQSGALATDDFVTALDESQGALIDTEARAQTFAENMEGVGDSVGLIFSEGNLPALISNTANNVGVLGATLNNAVTSLFGFADAQQGVIDQEEAMAEAHQTEIDLLTQQEELEQRASYGYETMSTNMDGIQKKIEELNQQYADNYETAYKNIDGSIGLFEEMTTKSGQSVESMIGSLKSQVKYMDNYQSNIRKAMELGVDKGLIQKLSDGSKESAEILQSIVDDGGENVTELNEEFLRVEEGKKAFSDTYASMVTDFDTKMSQIEKRVELAEDSLDAYDEMYKDGANSVQGFINGANSKLESVKRAFKKLGETAQRETEKTWNMHSPSKVMEKYGKNVTEGFAIGILKELDVVENAMSKLAPPDMNAMGSMAMTKTTRVVTVNAPVQVVKELNDAELNRVGGRITDIVGRQFAKRTGGAL